MWAMGFISFIESSIFPVPPDALMMPMVLARRDKAWRIATVCTLASVVGGLFGAAALSHDAEKAGGLDAALKSLLSAPGGQIMLTVVALGLVAYGIYSFARAKYARI